MCSPHARTPGRKPPPEKHSGSWASCRVKRQVRAPSPKMKLGRPSVFPGMTWKGIIPSSAFPPAHTNRAMEGQGSPGSGARDWGPRVVSGQTRRLQTPHLPSSSTDRPGRLSWQEELILWLLPWELPGLVPSAWTDHQSWGHPPEAPTTTCASRKPSAPGCLPCLPGACLARLQGRLHMLGTSLSLAGACQQPRAWQTRVTRGRPAQPPPCC